MSKKAIIVCPGRDGGAFNPSSVDRAGLTDGLLIGVDEIAQQLDCQVWIVVDPGRSVRSEDGKPPKLIGAKNWAKGVRGSPLLVGSGEVIARVGVWRGKTLAVESFWTQYDPHLHGWTHFPETLAAVYAANAGATQIDVYGAELPDAPKAEKPGDTSPPDPLKTERECWAATVKYLAMRGVQVARKPDKRAASVVAVEAPSPAAASTAASTAQLR